METKLILTLVLYAGVCLPSCSQKEGMFSAGCWIEFRYYYLGNNLEFEYGDCVLVSGNTSNANELENATN